MHELYNYISLIALYIYLAFSIIVFSPNDTIFRWIFLYILMDDYFFICKIISVTVMQLRRNRCTHVIILAHLIILAYRNYMSIT